jgi:DNA-directed RNA polymerase beta subunit
LVNGKFIDWSQGRELKDELIRARRGIATIPIDTGIVLDTRSTLFVHTDTSRLVRPLLIVEPVNKAGKIRYEPLIVTKGLLGAPIKTLFDEGVIEYVDCFEQDSTELLIAHTFEEVIKRDEMLEDTLVQYGTLKDKLERLRKKALPKGKVARGNRQEEIKRLEGELSGVEGILERLQERKPFTHVELDPTSILGVSANLIPYANHNQGPRNSYQASMAKQALGIMRAHHMACFNGTHKVLAFPTRPIFEPQLNQLLNLNAYPQGDMVWLAFSAETGFNQEDAFVFNRASIDAGKFRLFKYINHRITFKSEEGKIEKLMRPTSLTDAQLRTTYKHIDKNGLPTIGAYIEERQAIVGKAVMEGNVEIANESLLMGFGEKGIIDRVVVTTNGGETIVSVRLRMMRFAIEGDKFAPRNAQKGTIGKILDPEDMPYTDRGIIPDILVNPHAMPSRMTHTYLMEILSSKAGAIVGERVNATSFREYNENEFKRILRDYGYDDAGYDIMYSGKTGQRIAVQIFQGPTFLQALKHHVLDKMQARREGAVSMTTRQPVKGRSKGGGIRIGEMEQAAFGAHGVSAITEERLCGTSDCLRTVFCKCGQEAVGSLNSGYSCKLCGSDAEFGRVKMTYIMRLLTQFISALGLRQAFDFEEVDKGFETLKDKIDSQSLILEDEEGFEDRPDMYEEDDEVEEQEFDVESFLD